MVSTWKITFEFNTKFFIMKKTLLLCCVFMSISAILFAGIYEPEGLNMPGAWNGWANPPSNLALASYTQVSGGRVIKISTGIARWQTIFSVASSGADLVGGNYNWLFTSGPTTNPWANKWAGVTVSMNSVQSYTYNSGSDNNISITNGKYYCMNWKDLGYTGTSAIFMEMSASPITISSVSQAGFLDGSTYYAPPSVQVISITLSAAKCTEEQVYVRYSTDGWTNDNFVLATGSGTSYSATIPAQSVGTVVNYYVLTTTLTYSGGGVLDNNPDLCTIKYNNNAGSNYSYTVANPWTAQDGNWSSSSTWFFQSVPASTENVTINTTHDVVVDGSYTTNNLTISSGATLTINPDMALTVNGTLTNNAGNSGLKIESDATGTGSLIEYNGVAATVERYVTDDRWHYVSYPVNNPYAGVFMGMWLKYWKEPTGVWKYIVNPDTTLSTDMVGYALWTYNVGTVTFTGNLNTGSKSLSVTNTAGPPTANDGYNLAGNPYPSAINWNINDGNGWTRTNIDASIYIWNGNPGVGNYGTYYKGSFSGTNGVDSIIPPHQGFFIHCTSGQSTGLIAVNNGARIHNTKEILKSNLSDSYLLKLRVSGNNYSDEIILNKLADATVNFDNQFDALKLRGYELAPQLYSLSKDNEDLSINSFPETEDYSVIPIGLEVGAAATYTLSVNELAEFGSSGKLYLEDKKEGVFLKIEDENFTYSFTATPLDDPMRFLLHLNGEMGIVSNDPGLSGLNIYSYDNEVYVSCLPGLHGTVLVHDVLGQLLVASKVDGESLCKIDMGNCSGFMLVTVTSNQGVYSKKVFIR